MAVKKPVKKRATGAAATKLIAAFKRKVKARLTAAMKRARARRGRK